MVQADWGFAYATRIVHPVCHLMAGGEVLPALLPSVMEEVHNCPLTSFDMTVSHVHLIQKLVPPEGMAPVSSMTSVIPSALASALDPKCHLNCHALGEQIKQRHTQNSFQARGGSGTTHLGHSQQTQPLNSI